MQSLGYDLIVDDDGIIQEAGKIVEKTEDFEQKLGELSDLFFHQNLRKYAFLAAF